MEKSLSERIAARAVDKNSPPLPSHGDENQNRAAFLALRPDIKKALEDGWCIKCIWETLYEEGKVAFGYDTFRRYTKRLILLPAGRNPTSERPAQPDVAKAEPKTKETPPMGGFTFNLHLKRRT